MELTIFHNLESNICNYEVIERKGRGHPDTLSDALAEAFSHAYSNYTKQKFGIILHHNFDKVGLLGGKSYVAFGQGYMTSPIRVLLNGRASIKFGNQEIPVTDILINTARHFFAERLPKIDSIRDLTFINNISTGSSPGHVEIGNATSGNRKNWFNPQNLDDIREIKHLASNDTSVGCGYWPLSPTEKTVLSLEKRLTSPEFQKEQPWIGTDIKVMACRVNNKLNMTLCIPQIADYVPNMDAYRDNLNTIHKLLQDWTKELLPGITVTIHLNTKDNFNIPELYLTAIGSSIESGDEGLVGRGNRVNGIIAMHRPYSMEGACGKNPVYHVGKLYNIVAIDIAKRLYEYFVSPVEVWLISQEGRLLNDPWQVIVNCAESLPSSDVNKIIIETMTTLPSITNAIIAGEIELF